MDQAAATLMRVERLRERWQLARSILRYGGVGPFIGVVARGILRPLGSWSTFCFFERDLTGPTETVEAKIPLEIRVATDPDLDRFQDMLLREGISPGEIALRRARGDLCFVAVTQGRLAYFSWLFVRRPVWLAPLGATLKLGADEAYSHFAYTDPAMRGLGVQPAAVSFRARWERAAGIRRHFSYVMGHNVSGMKVMSGLRAGSESRRTRTVRTVRVLGVPGFLVVGLGGNERPPLEPGPHVDLGRLGLWIRPSSL